MHDGSPKPTRLPDDFEEQVAPYRAAILKMAAQYLSGNNVCETPEDVCQEVLLNYYTQYYLPCINVEKLKALLLLMTKRAAINIATKKRTEDRPLTDEDSDKARDPRSSPADMTEAHLLIERIEKEFSKSETAERDIEIFRRRYLNREEYHEIEEATNVTRAMIQRVVNSVLRIASEWK